MVSYMNNKNIRSIYGGLSTDKKPVGVENCSVFIEMDTSAVYMFDKDSGKWLEQQKVVCAL